MTPGHEHGRHNRKLPLKEYHWSFDGFKNHLNKIEHGLKRESKAKPTWTPSDLQIEQAQRLLNLTRTAAIELLRAAHITK